MKLTLENGSSFTIYGYPVVVQSASWVSFYDCEKSQQKDNAGIKIKIEAIKSIEFEK